MSIGSGTRTGEPICTLNRRVSGSRIGWCVWTFALMAGCAHQVQTESIPDALSRVSGSELFEEGVWHASHGDSLRAEQYLGAARDRGYAPEMVVAWLVVVCVASNRYRAALDHAARHLRSHPTNWWLKFVVASIHEALGDFEGARTELEQVVLARPAWPLPHYRLGILYHQRFGDSGLAAHHLERYRQLAPDGEHIAEVNNLVGGTAIGSMDFPSQLQPPSGMH